MSNGASSVNVGDVVVTIVTFGFIAFIIIFLVLIYRAYKKNVKRAEEKLSVEKQQTFNLQKQVDDLNERVGKIENLLKEVD
ncbi:hypothetical protein [Rummeliibacillus sp. TYF005]|mgnify:CR=1 FL=1|uniref:hypothetical protein n=1 Tax=Rummeliibacillus sp. TYF005 TaxID=2058214 RepID=UPI000F53333A|nr:hypothetical protein [Rummeliibacillus sp. TYF005]RPJ94329.1 hypothetical protein CW357_15920 [Rummeliibacillus sp. TYF005]